MKISIFLCFRENFKMGNQKRKSIEFEEEFMEISDENGDDTGLELPPRFSLSEPPIFEPPTQRYITRTSLDKGK
ncbi:hypothetical protein PVL29_023012 [Vitis rotundifolia]|uniref:Uncharacterized protein n=1 Tax=Vitis rotundifolia TaxID=103349 RepID=A0AA39DDI7_VITRO|nr:hypothetical protein PVL29_023012 [Vitis rotundifolia]